MRTPSSGAGGGRPRTCALALAAALGSGSCFVDEPNLTATTTDTTGGASMSATGDQTTTSTGETTGSAAVCGDGRIEGDEECDSGDLNGAGSLCTLACKVNVCGDGVLSPIEGCDDGDDDDADECTNACTLPRCGDALRVRADAAGALTGERTTSPA